MQIFFERLPGVADFRVVVFRGTHAAAPHLLLSRPITDRCALTARQANLITSFCVVLRGLKKIYILVNPAKKERKGGAIMCRRM